MSTSHGDVLETIIEDTEATKRTGVGSLISWINYNSSNLARVLVIGLFLGLAFWALYLDFRFGEASWIFNDSLFGRFLARTLITLGPELAGIVIGVVSIDYLYERRQNEQLKAQLIRQMGSRYPDIADVAVNELRFHGWGFGDDPSLTRKDLSGANLRGSDLRGVNLRGSRLQEANFARANLLEANLEGVDLWSANLENVVLGQVSLRGSILAEANMKNMMLVGTDLRGASLPGANLEGSRLIDVNLRKGILTAPSGSAAVSKLAKSMAILEGSSEQIDASLKGAILEGVDLTGALLKIEQLIQVKRLRDVIMPDGSTVEEWALERFKEGAIDNETFNTLVRLAQLGGDDEGE